MIDATAVPLRWADAHIHLFENGFHGNAPDELTHYERLRHAASIDDALVVGYEGMPRFAGNNAYILTLSRTHEWIHPLRFVDVATPPSEELLSSVAADGYAGVSLYLPSDQPAFSTWSEGQLRALAEAPLISINAGMNALAVSAPALQKLTEGSLLLLSHLGSPGHSAAGITPAEAREALAPLLAMANLPNTLVKLSALYDIDGRFPHTHAQNAVRTILDTFGPQHLVWGSDFSPALDTTSETEMMSLPDWLISDLDPAELAAVLGDTLRDQLRSIRPDREDHQ